MHRLTARALTLFASLAPLGACDDPATGPQTPTPWTWDLPEGVAEPMLPEGSTMSRESVDLGRALFGDPRISGDGRIACIDCHDPDHALADPRPFSIGALGEATPRNAPGLQNTAWYATYTWANPTLVTLEQQILVPLFGEFPVELGLTSKEQDVLARLGADDAVVDAFRAAWPDDADPLTIPRLRDALAHFVRALVSFDSPYDRWRAGRADHGMSDAALRGAELFRSDALGCTSCHDGPDLTSSRRSVDQPEGTVVFENTGLYDVDGAGSYPDGNGGLAEISGDPSDEGRFRPPSLRNVSRTGPWFHDASGASLDEIVRIYASGGREVMSGPNAGDGRESPNKSAHVSGFPADERDFQDLVAFLSSLTDETWLSEIRALNNASY